MRTALTLTALSNEALSITLEVRGELNGDSWVSSQCSALDGETHILLSIYLWDCAPRVKRVIHRARRAVSRPSSSPPPGSPIFMLLLDCPYVFTHLANGVNNMLPMNRRLATFGHVQGRSGVCCALRPVGVLIKYGLRIEPLCAARPLIEGRLADGSSARPRKEEL